MDDAKFEAELSRLEALAESYEAKMYEAPDLTTATGHYRFRAIILKKIIFTISF